MSGDELHAGLYEQVLTQRLLGVLGDLDGHKLVADLADLDPAEAPRILARHVAAAVQHALETPDTDSAAQAAIVNQILALLATQTDGVNDFAHDHLAAEGRALYAVNSVDAFGKPRATRRPHIPLSLSDLLVNSPREPSIGTQVERELESADGVDLLCAFITWHGVRLLADALGAAVARGVPVRILTTTYMGVTQPRALDALAALGAQIKVAYESNRTRLHAKAWLLHRDSGFSTGYVGSSNLSHSALVDGLEWNVRISAVESPAVLDKFRATFDEYWAADDFADYDPDRFAAAIARANAARSSARGAPLQQRLLDVHPTRWQQQALYQLHVQRQNHDRWHNLVVAATGTGKTVLAALDYRHLRRHLGSPLRLLFVAHRREILQQSLATFRDVLGTPTFGELYVAGQRPQDWDHVFASIQALTAQDPQSIPPTHFDVVIVDEFHHAEAATYRRLLDHLQPSVLLGMTATPERTDLGDVTARFDGRFAVELRVWTAIAEGWLCPFHYFGVADTVDLSALTWRRGGYAVEELDALVTGNDVRVRRILDEITRLIDDPDTMCGLGFCVSVAHANYMADQFTRAGLPARAVSAGTSTSDRAAAVADLKSGMLRVLFSVDLFNEGVDIPQVDTILLLRPTESATVFLQQLGRGLRWSPDTQKRVCTVLDLIGQQHKDFRWDLRFRSLTGLPGRKDVATAVDEGFPFLPAGCRIVLDRVASLHVLGQVKASLRVTAQNLAAELRRLGNVSLAAFLDDTGLTPEELYRPTRTMTTLRRASRVPTVAAGPQEAAVGRGFNRLLHMDDPVTLRLIGELLERDRPSDLGSLSQGQRRRVEMLLVDLVGPAALKSGSAAAWGALWDEPELRRELRELFSVLGDRTDRLPLPLGSDFPVPLAAHCRYSAKAILTALGAPPARVASHREGVFFGTSIGVDVFFITLRKSVAQYSPTTMYRDHAISPTRFHWESQSTTSVASPTGSRYVSGRAKVLLLVRETKASESGRTPPYLLLGPATYESHAGDRPMGITWRLTHAMPDDVFTAAAVAAG